MDNILKKYKIKEKIIKLLKEPIIYLLIVIAIIDGIVYSNIPEVGKTGDSDSYLHFYDSGSIFNGFVSDSRPPIYPYFIKVIKKIGGEANLEINVIKAQKILFFVSIVLFYCTIKLLLKNKIIICILTLIFGISPSIIVWNSFIITESITGLEILILTYITIRYLKEPSKILASLMGIVILGMVLTKPAFIYLLPIYILFVILRYFFNKEERKKLYFAFASLSLCCIILIMYCFQIKKSYGVFGLTSVSHINTMITIIQSGAYKDLPDAQISKELSSIIKEKPTEGNVFGIYFNNIATKFSLNEIKEYSKEASQSKTYWNYILNRFIKVGTENIGTSYANGEESNDKYIYNYAYLGALSIPITFGMVYIILLVSIVYLIWYLIKYKKINWICAFFTSTIFANLFTLIVGAPFEEQRLFFPSMCLVILYIGVILDKIKIKEENLLNEKNV